MNPFLGEGITVFKKDQEGLLRKTRQALFYSMNFVGDTMGVGHQGCGAYELGEEKGTIRPKTRNLFSKVIWQKILKKTLKSQRLNVCDQRRLGGALVALAKDLMANPQFRLENNWSHRRITD